MSSIRLADIALPDFGVPAVRPELDRSIYAARLDAFNARLETAGLDAAIVYADREHGANLSYLSGFDPRFEEALFVLVPGRTPLIITGPENQSEAAEARVEVSVAVYPPFGLLGQDRTKTGSLAALFAASGIAAGQHIGLVGWKYFGRFETDEPETWLDLPAYIVDTLRRLTGASGSVVNAAALLMDAQQGLRAINEIDQIAQFEFSAVTVTEAIKRLLFGLKPGMREFDAVALMGLNGLPHSCHTMLSTGHRASGLRSPSSKIIERGDAFTAAVGVWGALSSRAGWAVADRDELPEAARDYVERVAMPYFACAAEWYEAIGIGVTGGEIDALVRRHLGDPFFNLILNPGHLIGHIDEWLNTPVYPGSSERFHSGNAVQCDIIPAIGAPYFTINIEDGIALLDERGRAMLREKYGDAWSRIAARRGFMADSLHIRLRPEVLPLGNIPAYLPPYLLAPGRVLTRA
jgi:Xaa-Pro aminopeptidase